MFQAKMTTIDGGAIEEMDGVAALRLMARALDDLAGSTTGHLPPQTAREAGSPDALASGYAAASPIVRRRFEAILREAEAVGTTGLSLMAARGGRADAGTIAAARFLGNSLGGSIRRLEALVLPRAA
ncbi:hypothetical protein [Rhizorhabdus wittichii]|jgi:hypothetical protein|uniref:Uncharacterized protein n=1 Tax=Rhizorhabdus wittichii TaxID=160791 RepID=A0A975D7G5_9SPHN|nr:hypothetical protein [Rhizorhabdus wittichii]ARR52916.1 hypothetical protein HY78_05360 [Rhizorhabdus wittichii DC-6]QTH24317.1 hypothetical protein HRJ34_12870 [Rhizorhabdus wittichii]